MKKELSNDEVIIEESIVDLSAFKKNIKLTLTNKRLIFEELKGIFKKEYKVIEIINIDDIKVYKESVKIKQEKSAVIMQINNGYFDFKCKNIIEARKIIEKIKDLRLDNNILGRINTGAKKTTRILKDIGVFIGWVTAGLIATYGIIKKGDKLAETTKDSVKLLKDSIKK